MLRANRCLAAIFVKTPAVTKVSSETIDMAVAGRKGAMERSGDGTFFRVDEVAYAMPTFHALKGKNRYTRHVMERPGSCTAKPLENKVRCPWCHTYFNFTYEDYRRDPALREQYKQHEDSHTPPPGWEPDPRPMKGKGVTQYDARHRFGWMLGEEW